MIIAKLRNSLWYPNLIKDQRVNTELQALIELLALLLVQADPPQGRHHAPAEGVSQPAGQPTKSDLKPNPLRGTTVAEFVEALRQYRAWSGYPSWRNMAAKADKIVSHSTMQKAMSSNTLPKFNVMRAIVIGCGGSDEDLKVFTEAWRRVSESPGRRDRRALSRPVIQ